MTDMAGTDAGEPSIVGTGSTPMTSVRAGMDVDVAPINNLTEAIKKLRGQLKKAREEFEAFNRVANASFGAGSSTSAGTRMAGFVSSTPPSRPTPTPASPPSSTPPSPPSTGGGGGGGGMTGSGLIGAGISAIDSRMDQARHYALSADRMSVLYQQMTGLSQAQVQDRFRQPLTDFRLGAGGINQLLSMQATYGISARQQASGVEGLRTMTGYSLSTAGATNIITSLAAPQTANLMYMMGGGGLITPGGGQRNVQDVVQQIVRTAGLTDEKLVSSAMAPGSITRSRLAQMGVAPELQDIVLQYAQQNIQYKKAGGRGMYDPSTKEDRQRMGIEDNFATQAEETERLRVKRDEQFYSRQADNFADLERQTQKLVEVFAALEDRLSGLIGARISTRVGSEAGGALGRFFGGPIGGTIGNIFGTLFGFKTGDPTSSNYPVRRGDPVGISGISSDTLDASIQVPTYNGKKTLNEVKNMSSFKKLHPKMQERILRMMRENPNVGIGEGYRSVESQNKMFFDRYTQVSGDSDYDIEWNGAFWKKKPGVAAAAPPGRSMHGIGLAADLMGDLNWVVKNAHRFGLQHFADVNAEPWHVQLAELPRGFGEYEKSGAPLGLGPDAMSVRNANKSPTKPTGSSTSSLATEDDLDLQIVEHALSSTGMLSSDSISARVAMGTVSGSMGRGYSSESSNSGSSKITTTGSSIGKLSGQEVARLLHGVGFRGRDLVNMLAISHRESRWNPSAHNTDASTNDNSYGLLQLNTLGDLWKFYQQRGLSSREQLFDPLTNVRMAKELFEASKKWNDGNGLYYWGDYENSGPGSALADTDTAMAASIVNGMDFNRGDPIVGLLGESKSASRSSGTVSVLGGHTFNISPTIQMSGNGSTADLQQIAREVSRMIKRELELSSMRSN